jgi:hypothetical protein
MNQEMSWNKKGNLYANKICARNTETAYILFQKVVSYTTNTYNFICIFSKNNWLKKLCIYKKNNVICTIWSLASGFHPFNYVLQSCYISLQGSNIHFSPWVLKVVFFLEIDNKLVCENSTEWKHIEKFPAVLQLIFNFSKNLILFLQREWKTMEKIVEFPEDTKKAEEKNHMCIHWFG